MLRSQFLRQTSQRGIVDVGQADGPAALHEQDGGGAADALAAQGRWAVAPVTSRDPA
jgi:hypothetical protein